MNCPICRAALTAGSRFCNSCGASIGGSAPQHDRTVAYPPGQPPQPQAPYQAARPGAPAPGYAPPVHTPYGAPVPAPRKKPVALLAALIAVVLIGVGGATVALMKGKNQPSVVAGRDGGLTAGNPVTEVPSTSLPSGPAATSTTSPTPPSGKPVTASPSSPRPKGSDDMAPGVTMSGNNNPGQPSVTSVPNVPVPTAPAVTGAPNLPARPQAPVTGTPSVRPRPAPSVTGTPRPQNPTNDPVFDRYLAWLQFVENEKQKMTAIQSTMAQNEIKQFYDAVLNLTTDASVEADQRMLALPAQQMAKAAEVERRIQIFWNNMLRTKPPVPEDCKFLDYYYTEAARQSILISQQVQQALPRGDIGSIQRAKGQMRVVDANLKRANGELEKVRDVRRLPFTWMIQDSGSGGGAGIGLGLPGM